jgi:hypothetical protein
MAMNDHTEKVVNLYRPGEIIDFVSLARVLWHWRIFYASGFILLTVIGALIVFLPANKFRGEAVFQVGTIPAKGQDISLIEKTSLPVLLFKEGEALIHNPDHMRALMAQDQTIEKGIMEKFIRSHKKNQEIKKYFEPISNSSSLVQLAQKMDIAVIGFKLFYKAEIPDDARKIVNFFGNYLRDSYLAVDLSNYIRRNRIYHDRRIRECENRVSELNNNFAWTTNRKEKTQILAKRFPIVEDVDQKQLIFMKNTSTYFLSPKLNLMAIETLIIDIQNEVKRLNWEKELSAISLKFFSRANKLLASDGEMGITLLAKVNHLKKEFFAEENVKSPAVRYVDNSISNDLQRFQDIYFGVFKFVSGPFVSPDQTISGRVMKVIGIMVFNLFFLLLVILVIHWGKRNWQDITAKK